MSTFNRSADSFKWLTLFVNSSMLCTSELRSFMTDNSSANSSRRTSIAVCTRCTSAHSTYRSSRFLRYAFSLELHSRKTSSQFDTVDRARYACLTFDVSGSERIECSHWEIFTWVVYRLQLVVKASDNMSIISNRSFSTSIASLTLFSSHSNLTLFEYASYNSTMTFSSTARPARTSLSRARIFLAKLAGIEHCPSSSPAAK
ncbi:22.6 kDa [Spodoptera frugiperda ascovirus 1a]|uniref:22.6 kDa n=1 Tax=Spodoptera frugiperda ascovirus 1a TaxID=113370 RepID=Q0E4Z9_SFAVA|nr:22.6 kDa [Spodoptera frugiperda ascovirus 1a]CAL44702.1 22.6 kDa [Spodoptera frugiperda ascovirus 1a]